MFGFSPKILANPLWFCQNVEIEKNHFAQSVWLLYCKIFWFRLIKGFLNNNPHVLSVCTHQAQPPLHTTFNFWKFWKKRNFVFVVPYVCKYIKNVRQLSKRYMIHKKMILKSWGYHTMHKIHYMKNGGGSHFWVEFSV